MSAVGNDPMDHDPINSDAINSDSINSNSMDYDPMDYDRLARSSDEEPRDPSDMDADFDLDPDSDDDYESEEEYDSDDEYDADEYDADEDFDSDELDSSDSASGNYDVLPEGVPDAYSRPEIRGRFDGEWYSEDTAPGVQFRARVKEVLYEGESEFQKICVYDTEFFGKMLTLDDVVMFTERDEYVYHEMLVHVPLVSIPEPRSVLIVGGGDGGCAREALRHPSVEEVVVCDIDEQVTNICEEHFDWLAPVLEDERVTWHFDDGVAFIEEHRSAFDLIVIDSTDPVGPAVGLFLRDFYHKVAHALRPGGVMTAQTESPHWDPAMVSAIYGEIGDAFAHVSGFMGFIPTYPSGCWSWAYASSSRVHRDYCDTVRAEQVALQGRYYNLAVHHGAFALPTMAKKAMARNRTRSGRY